MESKRVPEIRFEGFSGDWEERKLGDLVESFEYGLNASAKKFDGENKYLRITDIDENTRKFLSNGVTSPNVDLSEADNYILNEQDILLARTGASVGKSYHYQKNDGKVYFAGFLIRARIKTSFDAEFIFQNTLTERYNNFVKITSQRSGQPGINATEYSTFRLKYPLKKEQLKISAFFKQLDKAITLHQQNLENLKTKKKGLLQKMFPKESEKVPEVRFPGFKVDWKQGKIGDAFIERSERSEEGELISVTIGSGVVKASDLQRVDNSSNDKSNYKVVKQGDIAYNSMRMWQGASGYSTYEGILSPAYTVITPLDNIDAEFFAYMFKKNDFIQIFKRNSQGLTSDTWNLKFPALKTIKVLIPTLEEQQKIGQFFKQLDDKIALEERELELLKETKKAFLQKMFV